MAVTLGTWNGRSFAGDDPLFVEDGVVDHGAALRREDDVDLAVARLAGARIREIRWPLRDIALERIGLVVVGRDCRRQGRPAIHAVIVDQEQPAAPELEEIDGRIRVREPGISPLAPGAAAVVRLGAHQVADLLRSVATTPA